MKTLVFIVTYLAESHIESVLARVPPALWNRKDTHFLVIDDASEDKTAELAKSWFGAHKVRNAAVLRNPVNQGYGGNQKLGYRYAIDNGFDAVILLHGDGQYAPEMLGEFIEAVKSPGISVVLGTRMHSYRAARAGRMPLYKMAGNIILTKVQNFLTGKSLSEYHTGYRAYRTSLLARIPFELNTSDFHFDTEILLQAFRAGAGIRELNIPTYYGSEISRVNGLSYAARVMGSTLNSLLQKWGFTFSLKFLISSPDYADKTGVAGSTHQVVLDLLAERGPRKVLDIGCGPGHVSKRVMEQGAEVTAVDALRPALVPAKQFYQCDLDRDPLPVNFWDFDAVLILDLVEHLSQPESFLLSLRHQRPEPRQFGKKPHVILSTANIGFLSVRLSLLAGRFSYGERGILDFTHKRLFTRKSLLTCLEDTGYTIERVIPVGPPVSLLLSGAVGRFLNRGFTLLARVWPTLFAFQFIVVCRPAPSVAHQLYDLAEPILGTARNKTGTTMARARRRA